MRVRARTWGFGSNNTRLYLFSGEGFECTRLLTDKVRTWPELKGEGSVAGSRFTSPTILSSYFTYQPISIPLIPIPDIYLKPIPPQIDETKLDGWGGWLKGGGENPIWLMLLCLPYKNRTAFHYGPFSNSSLICLLVSLIPACLNLLPCPALVHLALSIRIAKKRIVQPWNLMGRRLGDEVHSPLHRFEMNESPLPFKK